MTKQQFLFLVFCFLLNSVVHSKQYEINTQHSFINFEVDYMKVSIVKGTFDKFEGSFILDERTNKISNLNLSISGKSINTRDIKRDKHLRENDFFSVKKHPFIYFTGEEVKYVGGVPSEIIGSLEMVGVVRKISFLIDWKGFVDDPIDKGKKSLFLRVKNTIDRKSFGLNWNRALDNGGWIVSDQVRVDAIIEATPSDSRPAFSRFLKKNKKIKNEPVVALVNGKTDLSKETTTVKKKSAPVDFKPSTANKSYGAKSYLLLFFGFIIFLILIFLGGLMKKSMMSFLEKHMSERAAELISDFCLYSFLLAAAIVSAPYMGYGDYFSK